MKLASRIFTTAAFGLLAVVSAAAGQAWAAMVMGALTGANIITIIVDRQDGEL